MPEGRINPFFGTFAKTAVQVIILGMVQRRLKKAEALGIKYEPEPESEEPEEKEETLL